MRVSILGCGWVGLALGRALVARAHAVKGSSTRAEKLAPLRAAGIEPFQLELIHAPTPTAVGDPSDVAGDDFFSTDVLVLTLPPRRRDTNVKTRYPAQIAAALERTPAQTRVVFTGSTSVYADGSPQERGRTVTEEDAGGEVTDSGAAILEAETLLQERGATVLRLAGLYGYDRQPGRRLSGRELSGGDARVNLVHRDDVVAVMLQIIEKGVWGETFNVCAPLHPTRREVYTHQAERHGFAPPVFVPPHEGAYKRVGSQKLEGALEYRFLHPDPLADAP